eukprot:scaffold1474_cov256-Pinguiococcus_pyrenoidosus.AAC.3
MLFSARWSLAAVSNARDAQHRRASLPSTTDFVCPPALSICHTREGARDAAKTSVTTFGGFEHRSGYPSEAVARTEWRVAWMFPCRPLRRFKILPILSALRSESALRGGKSSPPSF